MRSSELRLSALAFATALLVTGQAVAQSGEKIPPLADGFPSRPITLINVDDPGSRDGVYARTLQEALHAISPVEILVSDEPSPSFGTFYTLGDVATREGGSEGYYPIVVSVGGMMGDLVTEPITEELGLTSDDAKVVIVTESQPYVIAQRKDAPWGKTFKELVDYAKAHPGELTYVSNQVGSGMDIAMEWLLGKVGIEVKKVPVPNAGAVGSTLGAGEGDFGLLLPPTALQHYQAGRIDVILVTGETVPAPWDKDSNVIPASDLGLPDPWGATIGLVVPKETPDEHVEWLYGLFKAASETELYRKRLETVPGTTINVLGPEQARELKSRALSNLEPVVRALGLHIEQKQ